MGWQLDEEYWPGPDERLVGWVGFVDAVYGNAEEQLFYYYPQHQMNMSTGPPEVGQYFEARYITNPGKIFRGTVTRLTLTAEKSGGRVYFTPDTPE